MRVNRPKSFLYKNNGNGVIKANFLQNYRNYPKAISSQQGIVWVPVRTMRLLACSPCSFLPGYLKTNILWWANWSIPRQLLLDRIGMQCFQSPMTRELPISNLPGVSLEDYTWDSFGLLWNSLCLNIVSAGGICWKRLLTGAVGDSWGDQKANQKAQRWNVRRNPRWQTVVWQRRPESSGNNQRKSEKLLSEKQLTLENRAHPGQLQQ